MTVLNKLFYSVLKELKYGYVTTYAFDCSFIENSSPEPDANIQKLCERKEGEAGSYTPVFLLYKPPEISKNPYTGQKLQVAVIPFVSTSVSDADVKKWLTDNIPDYTQRLHLVEDFEEFNSETGIKKVYLFS